MIPIIPVVSITFFSKKETHNHLHIYATEKISESAKADSDYNTEKEKTLEIFGKNKL